MNFDHQHPRVWLVTCGIASALISASAQPQPVPAPVLRIVSYMRQAQSPGILTEGSTGVFYSTIGQPEGVFSITPQGAKTILATFTSPQRIIGPLVTAPNGRYYSSKGSKANVGNMFSVGSAPGDTQNYPATDLPPSLAQSLPDGTLLGTDYDSNNIYHLLRCDPNGTVSSIYQFPAGETISLFPTYASDGNYYGVSSLEDGSGFVYRVTASGSSRTNLYTFPAGTFNYGAAAIPTPILQATDGNLYGSTGFGGANGTGTIYKLTLGGQYTLLYTFPAGLNYNPTALIEGSDGNLYGATWARNGQGIYQIFRVTTSGQYTQLVAMTNGVTEGMCFCWLTLGSDGVIYGAAQNGGYSGAGVIFALNIPMPIPAPRAQQFSPRSGPAGTKVLIWGQNLLGASVDFNRTPGTAVSNAGPSYAWATVPAGASTGPITVATPGGASTTQASFTVE